MAIQASLVRLRTSAPPPPSAHSLCTCVYTCCVLGLFLDAVENPNTPRLTPLPSNWAQLLLCLLHMRMTKTDGRSGVRMLWKEVWRELGKGGGWAGGRKEKEMGCLIPVAHTHAHAHTRTYTHTHTTPIHAHARTQTHFLSHTSLFPQAARAPRPY